MKPHRILIVEDNAELAKIIRFNLEAAGFQISFASNGVDALELAQRHEFDLLLTDHNMPTLTGANLCRILRQDPHYATKPMILLTGAGRSLDQESLMTELHLAAIIAKPYSPLELCNIIADTLVGNEAALESLDDMLREISGSSSNLEVDEGHHDLTFS